MSEDGSEFAGGLLFFFYNATDYTLVEIYETCLLYTSHLIEMDKKVYFPNSKNAECYRKAYAVFIELYQRNKDLFEKN